MKYKGFIGTFHTQATLHPFVVYYTESSGELHRLSFVVISDCLHHDTVAVHVFQKMPYKIS